MHQAPSPWPSRTAADHGCQAACVGVYGRERGSRLCVAAVEVLVAILDACHAPADRDRFDVPGLYQRSARTWPCVSMCLGWSDPGVGGYVYTHVIQSHSLSLCLCSVLDEIILQESKLTATRTCLALS
jgi:hypothetical protein